MRGISTDIQKKLLLSVGSHRATRPLTPVEVAQAVQASLNAGSILQEIAEFLHLEGTSVLTKFVRLLRLSPDVRHLVDWGKSESTIGFTAASEIARLDKADEQMQLCQAGLQLQQRKREYTQEEAEERFLNLVHGRVKLRPVFIKAHRGIIQRVLQILTGQIDCPIIGSARLCNEVEVYRQHGHGIGAVCLNTSEEGRTHRRSGRFIRFYGTGDEFPVQIAKGSTITLSAYMSRPDDPIMEYSDIAFSVALSNHADFAGTLEYIKATKTKYVVTDNTRGHAAELALEVTR